jgi:cytochrome b
MSASTTPESPGRMPGTVHVWDRFVRVFHWTLAAAFFVAYFTEDELLAIHVWAGFVTTPVAAWRYVLALIALRSRRHLGHSPAGGMMVLALLAGLALLSSPTTRTNSCCAAAADRLEPIRARAMAMSPCRPLPKAKLTMKKNVPTQTPLTGAST